MPSCKSSDKKRLSDDQRRPTFAQGAAGFHSSLDGDGLGGIVARSVARCGSQFRRLIRRLCRPCRRRKRRPRRRPHRLPFAAAQDQRLDVALRHDAVVRLRSRRSTASKSVP